MAPVRRPAKKCPHGRRRALCRNCGGASVCEHRRQRRQCRDCGGASFCEHGRQRQRCRDCGGASVCEHGRQRHHGRRRARCRDCGGASICKHGRQRATCSYCGGVSVCEHGRLRATCRDCGGTAICQHRRQRAHCRDCCNFGCQIEGCPRQDLPFSGAQSLLGHMRTMHGDNPRAVTKSKELEVNHALRDALITFEYQRYLPFRGCGLESETAHAFADFALPTSWGYVLLEVDEEQRKAYEGLRHGRQRGARQRSQAAGAALQPGRLQDRRPDAADHQEEDELLAREPEAPFTRLFLLYDRAAVPCVAEPVRAVSRCAQGAHRRTAGRSPSFPG